MEIPTFGAGSTGMSPGAASMDLSKTIQELYAEKERIDEVIASLEQFLANDGQGPLRRRRGRKSMGADERQIVSERMRSYWATRRKDKAMTASAD
jgi:hypothetical protein